MSSRYPNERWDRDRFDSYNGPGGGYERESFQEERDYYPSPPRRAPAQFAPRPPPVVDERERYARPPPRFYEEDERDSYAQAMVPAGRRPREHDHEYEIDIRSRERYDPPPERPSRGFQRPGLMRRPSSLDTHDRKPMSRYPERIREEVIPVPAPPRRRSPPRWRSPPRFQERDYYEDIRIAEPEIYGDEEFRGYREREISRVRRNRSPSTVVEERIEEREFPKKGKTKMPARLVEKKAIIQLGYPFEEEGRYIIIQRALGKEHIDEVISISRDIRTAAPPALPAPEPVTETRTTYIIEKDGEPPRIESHQGSRAEIESRHGSRAEVESRHGSVAKSRRSSHHASHHEHHHDHHSSHHSRRSSSSSSSSSSTASRGTRKTGRSHSRSTAKVPRSVRDWDDGRSTARDDARSTRRDSRSTRRDSRISRPSRARSASAGPASRRDILLAEERGESSGSLHAGVGALVISPDRDRGHRSQKSIKSEIKALEAERKALRYERDADRLRGDSREEVIIERNRPDSVDVRKDRKATDPRVIRAALATLT